MLLVKSSKTKRKLLFKTSTTKKKIKSSPKPRENDWLKTSRVNWIDWSNVSASSSTRLGLSTSSILRRVFLPEIFRLWNKKIYNIPSWQNYNPHISKTKWKSESWKNLEQRKVQEAFPNSVLFKLIWEPGAQLIYPKLCEKWKYDRRFNKVVRSNVKLDIIETSENSI